MDFILILVTEIPFQYSMFLKFQYFKFKDGGTKISISQLINVAGIVF